jgi:hypothetical protein
MGNILRAFGPDDEDDTKQESFVKPKKHMGKNKNSINISITSDFYNKQEYITREIDHVNVKNDSVYIEDEKRSDNDYNKYMKYKEKYLMMKNDMI